MKIVIPEYKIERRVRAMAHKISEEHKSSGNIFPPVMVCVLNGAFMFFSDLVKDMGIDVEIDFIRTKSYDGKESKDITVTKTIETNITNKRVYVVDDMVDTGKTIKYIINMLEEHNPQQISVVTLVDRKNNNFVVDHSCFSNMGDEWFVGYGFDDNGLKRNYRNLYDIK